MAQVGLIDKKNLWVKILLESLFKGSLQQDPSLYMKLKGVSSKYHLT